MKTIEADSIKVGCPADAVLLDVRSEIEHRESCLQDAHTHMPLDRLDPDSLAAQLPMGKDTPLLILCKGGVRAGKAAAILNQAGFGDVAVITGGLDECARCGVPVRKGKVGLSLERQVRIAAGSLVVAGCAAGLYVNHLFFLLPLFIGAGLVFAGITNRCGMALLLTRAPWNRG